MALTVKALVALADLKTELGISDTSQDAYLEGLIEGSSEQVANYIGSPLHAQSNLVEYVPGHPNRLFLNNAPLNTINSIEYDGTALGSSEYRIASASQATIEPVDRSFYSTQKRDSRFIGLYPVTGMRERLYRVDYDAGYTTPEQGVSTVPYAIRRAVIKTATMHYAGKGQDPSVKAEKVLSAAVTYGNTNASGLPDQVTALLVSYKLVR